MSSTGETSPCEDGLFFAVLLWSLQEMTFASEKPDAHVRRFAYMDAHQGRVDEKTILVGLDGSSDSDAALEWAVAEAEHTGRHLLLVHALPISESLALIPFSLVGLPDAASYGAHVLHSGPWIAATDPAWPRPRD